MIDKRKQAFEWWYFSLYRTIRRHEEEAKEILGERLYYDLDQMIFDLMDGARFDSTCVTMNGPQVHSGRRTIEFVINQDLKENKHNLPLFMGKYYHEIFGYGLGDYVK